MQKNSKKIPEDWTKIPNVSTRSELLEQRKKANLPDISFDLDGDGIVNGKDYCIGKRFDLDGDGKLNPIEKSKALAAVASGFDDQFIWGCDSSGINRSFRIVQKRGNVILNEEYNGVQSTYPVYPVKVSTSVKSKSELQESRQKEIRLQGKYYEQKMHKEYRMQIVNPYSTSNNFTTPCETYAVNPRFHSKAEMMEEKRQQLLEDLNNSCNYSHKSQLDRLLLREKTIYASPGLKVNNLHEKIKQENMQHFSKTFGNRPLGVHGQELPKFAENCQEYWKNKETKRSDSSKKLIVVKTEEKNGLKSDRPRKVEIIKKPTEIEVSENLPSKEHNRDSRWSNYHSKFYQKTGFDCEKVITKSATPDVNSQKKTSKPPKLLMVHRMMKRGGFSPGKDQLISTGFTS